MAAGQSPLREEAAAAASSRNVCSSRPALVALACLLVALIATGGAGARPAAAPSLTVRSSDYGPVLFDGRGFVLYAFTLDPRGRSACTGACAKAWPPYLVRKPPVAGAGVDKSLLGTTARADGSRQLTYAGRPLYYYVGDRSPGQILCQNVFEYGGLWLLVKTTGKLVR